MPPTWLKAVIFLCGSMGGLLVFFGLLWSIQKRTKKSSQGDFYRLSRDLYRLAVECPVKETYRPPKEAAIPTYEETMYYPLAEGPLQFPVQPEEDLQCHTPEGAQLGSTSFSPPPSYKSILLAQGPVSGSSAAGSSPG
ncbi:transmembrane protein 61 [Mus pahari]|uniref:transmembrane protein 61 n=1 Tax=Mus pahari TaxID=10093 RepID=UPI001114BE01|nr:transmembrane protein 61 [Mus pahari]